MRRDLESGACCERCDLAGDGSSSPERSSMLSWPSWYDSMLYSTLMVQEVTRLRGEGKLRLSPKKWVRLPYSKLRSRSTFMITSKKGIFDVDGSFDS